MMADHRNALGLLGPDAPTITKGRRPVALAAADAPAGPLVVSVRAAEIRRDGGTQLRAGIDPGVVSAYQALIADGDRDADGRVIWPFRDPVEAVRDLETGDLWLIDGFQRLTAWGLHFGDATLESVPAVPVTVREVERDGLRAAVLAAAGANAAHGAPRTNADKANAVDRLLGDPEWAAWSDREIAKRAGVSAPFVAGRRKAVAAKASGAAVSGSLGHVPPAPAVRKFVAADGNVRSIDTGNIGRKREFNDHAKSAAWGDQDSLEWGRQQAAAGNLAHSKLGGPAPVQPTTPPAAKENPGAGQDGGIWANKHAGGAGGAVDGLASVHTALVAVVDALPLLRREMADPASMAVWAKLQAAVVPAVERVGSFVTAKE